jgi:hypothetical protein
VDDATPAGTSGGKASRKRHTDTMRRVALAAFIAVWLAAGCTAVEEEAGTGSEPAPEALAPSDAAPGPSDASPAPPRAIEHRAAREPSPRPVGDGTWLVSAAHASATAERRTEQPAFSGEIRELDGAMRKRMIGVSWRPSCPVSLDDLRLLDVDHWDVDRQVRRGEMVVHADHAGAMFEVFRELFEAHFPIERMQLIDDFDGSDDASMAANNTSGFNCRTVTAGQAWSQHAYGLAIDINPVQNPYVGAGGEVHPPAGRAHVDRSQHVEGMIHPEGSVVRAFERAGWSWGGDWRSFKDYHHFSATGR